MSDETNEERQDNEFAVLKSIYDSAVVDKRRDIAWRVWRPLDLLLTLIPHHDSSKKEIHCSVTLHFKCCQSYPDKLPTLAIHKMVGLSTDTGTQLLNELKELANKLQGEVMIFELAAHTEHFLNKHNKPILSFYEQMVQTNSQIEKLKSDDLKAKEEEERRKIAVEIQKRQECLKEAGRARARGSSASQDQNSIDGITDAPQLIYYADDKVSPNRKIIQYKSREVPCTCTNKKVHIQRVKQRNDRKIYIGNCLGHSSNGSTTYLAIDDYTGEMLITKKWYLPPSTDLQTRNRQLTDLQQEVKNMSRLKHPVLVPYVALDITNEIKNRTSKQCVYLFRNFVTGTSLSAFIIKVNKFNDRFEQLKLVRHVATEVLSALDELHEVGLLHRDVRSENVYLDNIGGVKLVGASLDSKLVEILESENYCDRQTAAQDIYALGQLLLSIVCPDGNDTNIPQELPGLAKDFITRCMMEEEHSELTVKQLMEHRFIKDVPISQPNSRDRDDTGSGSEDDAVKKIKQLGPTTNGHSRLNAEFEVLKELGRGGFGQVLKVKNKLDGGFYAIKIVKLNPKSIELNKKITREVKLLSRLNHENVVRYYNAWIESTTDSHDEDDDENSAGTRISTEGNFDNSLEGDIAKLGQKFKVEWSISGGPVQKAISSSDSEDNDDDDDDGPEPSSNNMSPEVKSSSFIEFEQNTESHPSDDASENTQKRRCSRLNKVLYIQMEFCEKRTLSQAIEDGLYLEQFRAWRLFREIVEGLAHVHQRGMIHRDLKPVNIFLDSDDHVKIGDFGLATKAFTTLPVDDKIKHEEVGGSLTSQIGTALYVAPELLQSTTKVIYNQKVDIYSLGIILIEMFYHFVTGMERNEILCNIRTKDILMPQGFVVQENAKQIHVIRWLLNHDPSSRPTCAELLSSEHVPRPVHEGELYGLLSHTLSSRTARRYQRLVAACLDQNISPAEDYTYHNGMKTKPADVLSAVKDSVVKIFRSHGAAEFTPPLFIPRAKSWDQHANAVKVMTASGYVCHLPHDLRLPFARHTAYTGVKYMRRYVIDRVYREKHVPGFHPREIIECAFDIVTPKSESLWSDSELLVVAYRAATECCLKVSIQFNHTELIGTLLQSCGVPVDKHPDVYSVLVDVGFGRISSFQVQTHLTSLCISSCDVTNLQRLMEVDVPVHELCDLIAPYCKQTKRNNIVSKAIRDLEAVCNNAKALGCECPITVAPFLSYNVTQHSGVFWQMSVITDVEHKSKAKHRSSDLIAAGGRYDALVEEFSKVAKAEKSNDSFEFKSSSVGFSMSLERMAAILKKSDTDLPILVKDIESPVIYVCVWGGVGACKEGAAAEKRARLVRDLWNEGHATCAWSSPPRDAHELHRAGFLALHDGDNVRISSWAPDSGWEQKIPYTEVLEFIKQKMSSNSSKCSEGLSAARSTSWTEGDKYNGAMTSVIFITASDKMTKNSKRHCENQIYTQITSILSFLGLHSSRVRVQVLALACEAECVRSLAAHLTAPLHVEELPQAFRHVTDAYPKRRNILDETLNELSNIVKQSSLNRTNDETQLYALYSIPDSLCRLVT